MPRKAPALILTLLLVGFAGACSRQQPTETAEEAFEILTTSWDEVETNEEKTALAEDYLARFPDTENSSRMADAVAYYRGHEMEDPEGAYKVVSNALEHIVDPEQRFGVSMKLFGLSDSVDVPLDIAQVANDLAAVRPLTYNENLQVMKTATDIEEWPVAATHSRSALELATPVAYRADYPDREFTEEEVIKRSRTRKALALAYNGWASYQMGNTEEAFAAFAEADAAKSLSYLGVPDTPLYRFWGRAALREGDPDTATELLGADALFGEGDGALPYLREAYLAKNLSAEDFDEFLWNTRKRLARRIDDFRLPDYTGTVHGLSDVGDKVVLLAFWFPT